MFGIFSVVIHQELHLKILRPILNELAQSDLPFFSYHPKTVILYHFRKTIRNDSFLDITQNSKFDSHNCT